MIFRLSLGMEGGIALEANEAIGLRQAAESVVVGPGTWHLRVSSNRARGEMAVSFQKCTEKLKELFVAMRSRPFRCNRFGAPVELRVNECAKGVVTANSHLGRIPAARTPKLT
jgi:hypothetical protein